MITTRRFSLFLAIVAVFIFGGVTIASAHDGQDHDATGNAVTVRWTDIYSAPNSATPIGVSLSPNTTVTVLSNEGAWAKIQSSSGNGYVPRNALRMTGNGSGSGNGGGATTGNAVTVRWTDIYSAPNSANPTGVSLPPDTNVTVISNEGAWARIESSLGNGYVPRNALRQTGSGGGGNDGDGTTTGNAVTVRWTDIYRSPNANDSTGVSLPPGTVITVVLIDNNWAQMQSTRGNGWVPLNAITQEEGAVGGGDDGGGDDGDMGGTADSDLEKALNATVVNIYLEWNGQTRGPRVIQDIVNRVEMDVLNPAKVAYNPQTFFYVNLISAASADAINKALIPATPDCNTIVAAYALIALSPEFFSVPDNARNLVNGYEASVTSLVDTAKDAMLVCLNNATLSDLNRTVAKTGAERAFQQFVNIANAVAAMQ